MNRREFVKNVTATGFSFGAAPSLLLAAAQTKAPSITPQDAYALVDPELVPLLKSLHEIDMGKLLAPPPLPLPAPQLVERKVPGPAGAPEVGVIVVNVGRSGQKRPAFLHIHGGGFVAGTAMGDATLLQEIAQRCDCVVVSVDYRLAPKTLFPGALEDNYAALRWLYNNADSLGVERSRIAIGGESAGGYYAAQLAIYARDRKEIPIIFQMLFYPALDDRTGSSRIASPNSGQYIWTAEENRYIWAQLFGVPAGSEKVPANGSPARIADLSGLPPTFIAVGSIDLFAAEATEYSRRLIETGISTELHIFPGAYHGFDRLVPNAGVTKRFTQLWTAALQRAFAKA